jgi:hypothetical protein
MGQSPFEEYLSRHHFTPSQEIAIKLGCAMGFWATMSASSECLYYVALGLRKANHFVINSSLNSIKKSWHSLTQEPIELNTISQATKLSLIKLSKILGYLGLAVLPIGFCYIAIT